MLSATASPSQDAATLATLAGLALYSFSDSADLAAQLAAIDASWQLLGLVTVPGVAPRGLQAFFVRVSLPSQPRPVVVLALGVPWQSMMNWYPAIYHQTFSLPASIVGTSTTAPLTTAGAATRTDPLASLRATVDDALRLPRLGAGEIAQAPPLAAHQRLHLTAAAARLRAVDEALAPADPGSPRSALRAAVRELTGLHDGAATALAGVERAALGARVKATTTADRSAYDRLHDSVAAASVRTLRAAASLDAAPRPGATGTLAAQNSGLFDLGYLQLYNKLRTALWAQIAALSGFDLSAIHVVGHAIAAPLAQLAALDLRPGKPGTTTPAKTIAVTTFSTPAMGDADFAAWFSTAVPGNASYRAQGAGSPIDFFPTPGAGLTPAGNQQALTAALPSPDDPWIERSSGFYQGLLSGASAGPAALVAPASIADAAALRDRVAAVAAGASYNPDLAYTLALLAALAYQRFQHPDLGLTGLPAPWTFVADIQTAAPGPTGGVAAGITFASIFTTPTQVAVALRGTATWEELFAVQGDFQLVPPGYSQPAPGTFGQGQVLLYGQLRDGLRAALAKIPNLDTRDLFITGHSMGGGLATLCAVDLQASLRPPTALYTFGAPPVGDYDFLRWFTTSPLAANTFRVTRNFDVMPAVTFTYTLVQAPTPAVLLPGFTADDDATSHPISTYIELLNPQARNQ